MVKVAVLDDYHGAMAVSPHIQALRQRADVTVWHDPPKGEDELVERLRDTEVIIALRERTRFPAHLLQRLPSLRFIAQTGNHIYHIDLEAATRLGIAVALDPQPAETTGPAELTFGLMLAVMRGICRYDALLHSGGWEVPYGRVLAGKTLGLIGAGRVGSQVARIGNAFRMRVLAWSRSLTDEKAASLGAERVPDLQTLLTRSDIVSVHVPLSNETVGLLGPAEIASMRPGAVLINTSRGPIVDEAALVEALRSGRLAGAGLDVFDEEPLPLDHPLRTCPNAVLTPHAGWQTDQAYEVYAAAMARLVERYLDGQPEGVVNPEALSTTSRDRKISEADS